jgi:hypothetical protein
MPFTCGKKRRVASFSGEGGESFAQRTEEFYGRERGRGGEWGNVLHRGLQRGMGEGFTE